MGIVCLGHECTWRMYFCIDNVTKVETEKKYVAKLGSSFRQQKHTNTCIIHVLGFVLTEQKQWSTNKSQHLCNYAHTAHLSYIGYVFVLQWRHNRRNGVSNHLLHHCLLNRLFKRRPKKSSKLRVTGVCAGNSPVTGNVSIWGRRHGNLTRINVHILCWMTICDKNNHW